jgi:hypothetical protein
LGIYEDGWIAEDSYVVLAAGAAADLVVRADVLPHPGQRLDVIVNGRRVPSKAVRPGPLDLRIPLQASRSRRRVELQWAAVASLAPPDRRPACAHLTYLGLMSSALP